MLEKHLVHAAQQMLQARLDGKLKDANDMAAIWRKVQPANGFAAKDIKALTTFALELHTATNASDAKLVAQKYNLSIVY